MPAVSDATTLSCFLLHNAYGFSLLARILRRAWITVDRTLYLWNYFKPDEFEVYDALSEAIISVALSVPKVGIFQDSVKYVLAIATPVEVVLLALCVIPGSDRMDMLKLVPTAYTMPTDNVTMLKVVGSSVGRIFMAGNDGSIYELDYCYAENPWSSLVGGVPKHKCRKINHCAWQWKLVHLLPPFLRSLSEEDDTLVDIFVDNLRNVMYAISSRGSLSAFYLGHDGRETSFFGKSFNVLEETRSFLSYGRGVVESSPKADLFRDLSAPGFQVVGMFSVPQTESKRVHLVVVLGNGIRIYISLMSSNAGAYTKIAQSADSQSPTGLEIAHVRSPPSPAVIASCSQRGRLEESGEAENGSLPSISPTQSLHASCAFYGHGLYCLALEKPQQPDELAIMFEDIGVRASASGALPTGNVVPCMREGVTVGLDASNNTGKIFDIRDNSAPFLNATYCELRALAAHSLTPANNSMVRETSQFAATVRQPTAASTRDGVVLDALSAWLDNQPPGVAAVSENFPLTFSNTMLSTNAGGYDPENLDKLLSLSEVVDQHLPAASCFTQRQVLVLTNQGVHVFKKVRPADVIYRYLSQLHRHSDDLIKRCFAFFGHLQSSVMCLALACGIPRDAGGSPLIDNTLARMASTMPLENIQVRAINTMLALSYPATYRALEAATQASVLHDSRLVVSGSNYEFFKSTAHDALYCLLGRLLRPIWLRPVVRRTDLRIPSYWRSEVTSEIRRPLAILADLLRSYYSAAIMGNYAKSTPEAMASAASGGAQPATPSASFSSPMMVTDQIAARAQPRVNSERMLQFQAKSLEDASLQSLYLLVSRSIHALSLIDILNTLITKWKLSISLVELADLTFRSLVGLPKAHTSVKKILHEVIQAMATATQDRLSDEIIETLSRDCYHYFSAGDRYSFEAFRLVDAVNRCKASPGSAIAPGMSTDGRDLHELASKSVDYFLKAASSWNSLEDVVGDRSELQQSCSALQSIPPVGYAGIVDVAMKAASSFRALSLGVDQVSLPGSRFADIASPSASSSGGGPASTWDKNLFHGGSVLTPSDAALCVSACYNCLVQQIMWVGAQSMVDKRAATMTSMVQRAVHATDDVTFHEMLFTKLVDEAPEVLLDVSSPHLEPFLRGYAPTFLYKYYDHIGEHRKAAALMAALAMDEEDVPIANRLIYLRNALRSAELTYSSASSSGAGGGIGRSNSSTALVPFGDGSSGGLVAGMAPSDRLMMHQTVTELKDALDVAEYQHMAWEKLSAEFSEFQYDSANASSRAKYSEAQRRQLDAMQQHVRKLHFKLLDVNALFHDVCLRYRLWDICIMLIHVCGIQDTELLTRLWRSFIYRYVSALRIYGNRRAPVLFVLSSFYWLGSWPLSCLPFYPSHHY